MDIRLRTKGLGAIALVEDPSIDVPFIQFVNFLF